MKEGSRGGAEDAEEGRSQLESMGAGERSQSLCVSAVKSS